MPDRPPNNLQTERLFLRRPVVEDAVPIFEQYAQDEEISRYLTWEPHKSIADTKSFLKRCRNSWQKGSAFPWTIIRKSDSQLLGMIEIVNIDQSGVSIGYVLARAFWGNGYMTEALRAVINWSLSQTDVYRVWAICDTENQSSARVMKKAGMQKEGILRRWVKLPRFGEIPRDCYCFSIVK